MRECPVVAEFVDKVGGEEALLAMSRRRPNLRNGVATAIEEAVAELVAGLAEQPAWGQVRMRQRAGQARERMIAAEWPTDTGNQADSQAAVRSDPGFYIWPLRGPLLPKLQGAVSLLHEGYQPPLDVPQWTLSSLRRATVVCYV